MKKINIVLTKKPRGGVSIKLKPTDNKSNDKSK